MVQVSSLCSRWPMDVGSVHSCQKAISETRGSNEVSVDRCRTGTSEVEGRVSSEAGDKGRASERDERDRAQRALGKVWLRQDLDCAER